MHAGALVRWNGAFHRVADPLRHFADGIGSLPNPVGSPIDKALVGLFRLKCLLKTPDDIFQGPETSTYSRLKVCHGMVPAPHHHVQAVPYSILWFHHFIRSPGRAPDSMQDCYTQDLMQPLQRWSA